MNGRLASGSILLDKLGLSLKLYILCSRPKYITARLM